MYLFVWLTPGAQRGVSERDEAFGNAAQSLARAMPGTVHRSFSTAREILEIVAQYDDIQRFVIFGHGGPTEIGHLGGNGAGLHITRRDGNRANLEQFARVIGPRLAPNPIIGLAACTCGTSFANWEIQHSRMGNQDPLVRLADEFSDGQQESFAGRMRDALVPYQRGVQVRAHTIRGHTTNNPRLIYFIGPARSAGRILARDEQGEPGSSPAEVRQWIQRWMGTWTGARAEQWIIGGPGSARPRVGGPPSTAATPAGVTGTVLPSGETASSTRISSSSGGGAVPPRTLTPSPVGHQPFAELYGSVARWASGVEDTLGRTLLGTRGNG